MRHQTTSNFKLGLIVSIALAIFIIAVYLIGNKRNMFSDTFRISAVFQNVNGLQTGNNVRLSGINVGTVDNITITSDSTVEVYMKIDSKVRQYIKKDALAGIGSDGLVGNMLINISPGSGDFPPVENSDRIAAYSRTEADDILSTLSNTNENIAILSRDLLTTTKYINEGEGTITALLKDSSMVNSLKVSLSNLETVSAGTVTLLNRLSGLSRKLENNDNLLNLFLSDTVITSQVEQVVLKLDESSSSLEKASADLQNFTETLTREQGSGPINTLLYDSAISNDLKVSIHNIREGTVLLNENLEAMREHFLFRKYFKKQEKQLEKESKKAVDQ